MAKIPLKRQRLGEWLKNPRPNNMLSIRDSPSALKSHIVWKWRDEKRYFNQLVTKKKRDISGISGKTIIHTWILLFSQKGMYWFVTVVVEKYMQKNFNLFSMLDVVFV